MAYVTFAQVAEDMQGEPRLRDLLEGHPEDLAAAPSEPHPFFDTQAAIISRRIDASVEKAGYTVPLSEPYDPLIRKIASALIADLLSKSSSNREPWIDAFATWAEEQLTLIEDGSLPVENAEPSIEPFDDSIVEGTLVDAPLFDRMSLGARVVDVFPPIDLRRRDRDRWG